MSENLPESVLDSLGVKSGKLSERIRAGKVTLADVVKVLVPDEVGSTAPPAKIPLPAVITPLAQHALDELGDVFGSVVPTERRILSDDELEQILVERETIDTILKLLETRKSDSIKTTILNHLDVVLEDTLTPERLAELERDKDGHYYYAEKVEVPGTAKAFSWEVTDGTPQLSPAKLKELDEAGEIDHALYLEITEPIRTVNEQKLLLAMSKRPEEVLKVVRAASIPAKKKGSLYVRNA